MFLQVTSEYLCEQPAGRRRRSSLFLFSVPILERAAHQQLQFWRRPGTEPRFCCNMETGSHVRVVQSVDIRTISYYASYVSPERLSKLPHNQLFSHFLPTQLSDTTSITLIYLFISSAGSSVKCRAKLT